MAHSTAAVLILGLVCSTLLMSIRTAYRKHLRSIPGPCLARFTGVYRLSLVWKGDAPEQYRNVHAKHGKIVRVGPNHVSVSDPSEIQTIYGVGSKFLKTEFYTLMGPFYKGDVMHTTFSTRDPAYHRNLRSQVAAVYSMSNVRKLECYADECSAIFIDAMKARCADPIDIAPWLQWYAFDVIGGLTFQRRFGFMEKAGDIDNMIGGLDVAQSYAQFVGQFPKLHDYLFGSRVLMGTLKRVFPNLPDPLDRFMAIAEEEIVRYNTTVHQDGSRGDILAQLQATKDGQVPFRDVVNHITNNLIAGSDTTAISLRACIYYLLKTPHAYHALQGEIDAAFASGRLSEFVTYEESTKLPYLQATIKEAMRLHPGVGFPLERHVPPEGAVLCGKYLPGGTNVSMTAPVVHHDRTIFGDDAESFRPERWLETDEVRLKQMDRCSLAFGHGARSCSGKNISLMEMGKFIPVLLRNFELEWASEKPEWTTYCAWFWKQSDMLVRLKLRRQGDTKGLPES
ncbi:hypothetical protein H2204_015284 [Knufia peltigerae]|uniref:Cytochrome P450 n=1 Tax=Knufia peltigerae TaxID=1002370 RepID=A0AA39CJX7_9EURO|nr:hypothetical protein H2204_015284 [Knufia peltigerae]